MEHLSASQLFLILAVMLTAAKLGGTLAVKFGQPAVLGELIAGVVLGGSVLNVVNPHVETIHMLSELGVLILLLAIGLETDLGALLGSGATSAAVAVVGVAAPFLLGYLGCRLLGINGLVAITAGATLTATSVGITARVLADLGRLQSSEGQVILGAAVIDDILGLIVLTIIGGMADGGELSVGMVAMTTAKAFGFLIGVLVVGRLALPPILRLVGRVDLPGTPTIFALILALVLAWAAEAAGSAMIIGAFAAGVLIAGTNRREEIEHGITSLGHLFVPLFFVTVGASVDLTALDPRVPEARTALMFGGMLIATGVIGKLAAGYAPFWYRGDKRIVGVGMIPRGEVGLIFAQMGLAKGVFDAGLFGGVTLMVIVTTFMAPPWLKKLAAGNPTDPRSGSETDDGVGELVNDA